MSSESTSVVNSTVTKVTNDYVEIENGDILYYDYLILASGSRYSTNLEGEFVVDFLNSQTYDSIQQKFENAKNITVIGGGPVGIEVTGEIAVKYPEKIITLISQSTILLKRTAPNAHTKILKAFTKLANVRPILGVKVIGYDNETKKIKLDSNLELDADLVIPCTGFIPNTEYMKETTMVSKLTDSGLVKVNSYLQVEGMFNVFAGGDIIDLPEENLAQNAERHAEVMVENIISLASVGKPTKSYSPNTTPTMVISIGPKSAMLVSEHAIMVGKVFSTLKSLVEIKIMSGLK